MAGMGPPPKHPSQRRRTNPTVALTRLPAEGRTKPAPDWPLIPDVVLRARRDMFASKVERLQEERQDLLDTGDSTGNVERKIDTALERLSIVEAQLAAQKELEDTLWADLWKLPQAVEWERLGWLRDVAQYARFKVMGELGELDAAKEARMWSDRLGLTPLAMLRLRWEVSHDEVAERRSEKPAAAASVAPSRRLRVVDNT
jgi:hypothetical protein